MNEEEFDAWMQPQPFGTADVLHWEAERRATASVVMTLGAALWGETSEDAQHQLLAPHPEIPAGYDLSAFRKLLQWTAAPTAVFAVQWTPTLSPPNWTTFTTPATSTTGDFSFLDDGSQTGGRGSTRFYRLLQTQ